jgi:heme exporter protein A
VSAGPRVEARGLGHAFGERVVLRGVDLRVEPGSSLAVFGPNGAGKSTLLRALAGLVRPLKGEALIDGTAASDAPPAVRRRVGYVSHRPLVWGGLSARENLLLYARLYGVPESAVDRQLSRVGLDRRAGDLARSFSQGMRQRLGIARALLHEPDLLVLDEPASSLDEEGAALIDALLREARGTATVLLATHDRERGRALCEHTATLREGALS